MEELKSINEIPNKITITVIGKRCSGKTTLLNSLIFPKIINNNNYVKTFGYDMRFLPINDNIIIKLFDIGELEIETNESVFQSLSWYSHYVIFLIDPKIKESLQYIDTFEDVFKKNKKMLIFNKMDQVPNKDYYTNDKDIQKFLQKLNPSRTFYVNSIDQNSVNNFKKELFDLIQQDIFDKIFNNIRPDDFYQNPVLFHKPIIDRSKKIGC